MSDKFAREHGFLKRSRGLWECAFCGGIVGDLYRHRSRCKRFVLKASKPEPTKRWWQ